MPVIIIPSCRDIQMRKIMQGKKAEELIERGYTQSEVFKYADPKEAGRYAALKITELVFRGVDRR